MNALAVLLLQVSTQSLLEEMNDLDRLARPAEYTCRQFSSYDRASHRPGGWFANNDRGHYLRTDGGEFVLAEADGPGAIVRIWSANPSGTLRIYLDGEVVLNEDFGRLLSGKVKRFAPPFGAVRSRGGNLYFPFPYAKSMKVTSSRGGQYYHVNYRTWSKGTKVKTYSPEAKLRLPDLDFSPLGDVTREKELKGPGVVRRLEVPLSEDPKKLRELTLRIVVDGELCVWSPLGDFFGTAPGRTPHAALPLGITKEGVGYCNYPMPFAKSLRIEVDAPVKLWRTKGSRPFRFHAWWRGTNKLKTRPMSDWPVLRATGRGRFVGCFLAVRNPVKAWWGEGDEKVYVDGEEFPSTFGTGTEDYFGYAWCDTAPFQAPYHNQTRCDGPGNRGQTAVARYHVLDDIPFRKSVRFDMEVWHWSDCTIGYSTVAYWYAAPGSKHEFKETGPKDREIAPLPEVWRAKGAIEGESLKPIEKPPGICRVQDLSWAEGFSREAHLWWRGAGPGDVLRLRFESPVAGKRTLVLALTKAKDYGIVKISVNGNVLAERIDLYNPRVVPAGERAFKGVTLRKGANELRVEIVGANQKADPTNYMFGIDYLKIRP